MMFPSEYLIDYVRVYQRKNEMNVGCDPKEFPTAKYISDHIQAYMGTSSSLLYLSTPQLIYALERCEYDAVAMASTEKWVV